ncbi:MAG: polysulfide reductase NrfD [Actinomycetota bacterium]|nr:polysulfide reductase NrfD [Actinomycetota bacterium]
MRARREQPMVPAAEFRSYYGRQVIHTPTWKVPDVPAYLYLGGLAGTSATMAALADVTNRPALRRSGRLAAGAGAMGSVAFLVHDLGVPTRFLNMLRVFKPTSPLSVGSWILAPFSGLAAAAALSELTGRLPFLGRLAGVGSAALGPPLATYTAVLLADTAVPSWHEVYRELPFAFAGSAMASGAGVAMVAAPPAQAGPARRLALLGGALELAAVHRLEHGHGLLSEPYLTGRAGTLLRMARGLTAAGAAGSLVSRRSRSRSVLSGALLTAGSVCMRFGVFQAGIASAKDPKYTVVPQRERLQGRHSAV